MTQTKAQLVDLSVQGVNANNLSSGTVPDARFPAVLPAISGANLTNLPSSGGISNVVEDTSPQLGGNLDVLTREITTSTTNGDIVFTPDGTGIIKIKGAGSTDGTLQLNCSAQSHGVKLKSPAHSAGQSYTGFTRQPDSSRQIFEGEKYNRKWCNCSRAAGIFWGKCL